MEAGFLGFKEEPEVEDDTKSSSGGQRLVPWLNWDEWLFVKDALFSDSPQLVYSALKRISTWHSRGSVPVLVNLTAFIIANHRKDPYFRQEQDQSDAAGFFWEEQMAALHCAGVTKLINATIETTRRENWVSMAVAADAIGMPRMLVDVRHEASHREFPSLTVARMASIKALDWIKSHYWETQSKAIPFQGEGNAEVKKEIKSKVRELAICLKFNGNTQSSNSHLKGKRSKKQITKIRKSVLKLYSSYSSEIVSVLLEYLLKALNSSELKNNADASGGLTIEKVLADWKLIMLKLTNKEPELLLNLLKEVLDMIETLEDTKSEEDNLSFGHSREEFRRKDYLPFLFAWLVGILGKVPSAAENMPKRVLHELLHKCLLISQLCNKQFMDSALHLAEMMNDSFVLEKVHKLSLFALPNFRHAEEQSSLVSPTNITHFEESMREAAKKLELVKQQIMKNKKPKTLSCETKKSKVWTLLESWNPCPIGMLPRAVGSSGCLPVLDIVDNEQNQVSERKENWKLIPHGSKRDATLDLELLDNSTVKKMRETKEFIPMEREKGLLMVDGVWKRVTEEELKVMESSVRILV